MLPVRICEACRDGQTNIILSWLAKNKEHESWKENVNDKWVMIPEFVNAVENELLSLHVIRTFMCMYLIGFHGQENTIKIMLTELKDFDKRTRNYYSFESQETDTIFASNLLSWVVYGVARAGNITLLKQLESGKYGFVDNVDVLIGACRGNHLDVIKRCVWVYKREVHISYFFGASLQSIELFMKHLHNKNPTPDPNQEPFLFLYALLTRDFAQAKERYNQWHWADKYDIFEYYMRCAAHIGDVQMMELLLQCYDSMDKYGADFEYYNGYHCKNRDKVLQQCVVRIIMYGHKHALDWIMTLIPPTKRLDTHTLKETIYYGQTELLVKLNRGNEFVLPRRFIPTYLNYGGRVIDRLCVGTNDLRRKKQQLTLTCLLHVLSDKCVIQCVILNATSYE